MSSEPNSDQRDTMDMDDRCMVVAFATADGKALARGHFGDCSIFLIYQLCEDGTLNFVEDRSNVPYAEKGHGDPGKARVMADLLRGVDVLVGRRFGPNVERMLKRFVCVRVRAEDVEDALGLVSAFQSRIRQALRNSATRKLVVLSGRSEEPGNPSV